MKLVEADGTVLASSGITGTYDVVVDATLAETGTHTVVADGAGASIGAMTLALANPEDDAGIAGTDQTPATGDDTVSKPAAPQPTSPSGPVPPESYTTEVWSSEETGSPDGLRVISSTAPSTSALTGVVIDGASSEPVPGATVTLTRGNEVTSTTTDGSGAYAFINMPPGEYDLDVSAIGYGLFTLANAAFDADEKYQETASLLAGDQLLDASQFGTTRPSSAEIIAASDTYPSAFRPPPTVRVALYTIQSGGRRVYHCDKDANGLTYFETRTYPWKYYVERTLWGEVKPSHWPGGRWFPGTALRSIAQSIHTYGWFWANHRRLAFHPEPISTIRRVSNASQPASSSRSRGRSSSVRFSTGES